MITSCSVVRYRSPPYLVLPYLVGHFHSVNKHSMVTPKVSAIRFKDSPLGLALGLFHFPIVPLLNLASTSSVLILMFLSEQRFLILS